MSESLFVHVGFHKTATTWFQNNVFPYHPQIQYLGKSYPDHPCPEMKDIRDRVVGAPDSVFDTQTTREHFNEILEKYPANGHETYGLSYEGLSAGDDWFGGKSFYVADRLSGVLEDYDTKIIIGLREQRSMMESMYSEYVKLGGTKSLERLLFSPFSEGDSILGKLKYEPFVQYYREIFGEDNVHVYLLEQFKSSPDDTTREILNFLEIEELPVDHLKDEKSNPRLSSFGLPMMRFSNHFFHGPLNNLSPVTMGSYLLSKLFMKIGYQKDFIEDQVERDYPAAYQYKYDQIIQNKLRHLSNEAIKKIDKWLFQSDDNYRYRLNSELREYLANYYRKPNESLNEAIQQNLSEYGYALP